MVIQAFSFTISLTPYEHHCTMYFTEPNFSTARGISIKVSQFSHEILQPAANFPSHIREARRNFWEIQTDTIPKMHPISSFRSKLR